MSKGVGNTEIEGTITEAMPNSMFRIDLADGRKVLATVAGRMRKGFVRILPGDRVVVEMTPYDKERGRIIFRYR
ncbi:translation initiation factor IF-1 [Candidatus Microgenomates bacterium]|nr:translation initiation factor IF-1 [Candidatus Microgenomates bacterium]